MDGLTFEQQVMRGLSDARLDYEIANYERNARARESLARWCREQAAQLKAEKARREAEKAAGLEDLDFSD